MRDTFKEKQYRIASKLSRYSNVPSYNSTLDGCWFNGTYSGIAKGTLSRPHTVKYGDTLDSLSLYYYNNPTYFWLIADFNNIIDPYKDLVPGEVLNIPTFSFVEFR